MAGSIRPNQYMSEANYNFIGGLGSQGSQAKGLFNGSAVNEWNTANVMYWAGGNEYVEFEVFNNFHIWRAGTTGWNNLCNSLKIKKYNSQTLVYEDVTINYPQKLTAITEKQWEKTISNLPKGKYRVEYGTGGRIDSEWFLENAEVNKSLILNDGEYKKWNEEIPAIDDSVNAIPIMTSDIIPKGVVSSSGFRSGFPPYHAFDNNSSTLWRLDLDPVNHNCWLMYEFEKPKIIERIEFGSFNLSGGNHGVKNFEILGSNDGMSFTNLYTGVHPNNANLVRYSFVNNEKFKMYKLKVISSYTGYTAVATLNMYEQKADKIFGHWTVESTSLPNSIQFLEQGMDNLSPLLDRKVLDLEPMTMTDKSEILGVGDVGKVFGKTIDLKKYFDIRSMKVEVK